MSHPSSPLARMGRFFFWLLCGAGLIAGIFVLLCAVQVIDPDLWLTGPEAAPASAPTHITAEPPMVPEPAVLLSADQLDPPPDPSGPPSQSALPHQSGTVVIPMKEPDGSLQYVSALPLAADCGASSADPQRNAALRALNQRDTLHTVALVSCLQDSTLVQHDPKLALHRVSGSPWRDPQRQAWLDPAQPTVQNYLTGICRELAWLGFDEIVLTGCAFPTQGDLSCLRDCGSRSDTLAAFCRTLQGALSDFPTELSILGTGDQQTTDPLSGQTPAVLAAFCRVWSTPSTTDALAAFSPVLLPSP